MSPALNLTTVCEILRDLQRDCREEPFFKDLFASRASGFIAASSAVRPELMSAISVEQVEWSWAGLCELLDVPLDVDVDSLDDLLDVSDAYSG